MPDSRRKIAQWFSYSHYLMWSNEECREFKNGIHCDMSPGSNR
jgi:hypothetical protein